MMVVPIAIGRPRKRSPFIGVGRLRGLRDDVDRLAVERAGRVLDARRVRRVDERRRHERERKQGRSASPQTVAERMRDRRPPTGLADRAHDPVWI